MTTRAARASLRLACDLAMAPTTRYVRNIRSAFWRELQHGVPSTLIQAFLTAGLNPDRLDAQNTPPLVFVADQGSVALADLLIRAGANVNASNASGISPLMAAAMENRAEMMRALLAAGADPEQKDALGQTALMKAACYGDYDYGAYEAVEYLLNNGADVMAKTKQGKTALYYAMDPDVRALLERAKMALVRAKRFSTMGGAPT